MAQAFITRRGGGGGGVNQTLPYQITAFEAVADSTPSITLSWINPTEYWAGTLIVRKAGSMPDGINDGIKVYNGTDETFTDTDVEFGITYHYRAFPYNEKKQYQTEVLSVEIEVSELHIYGAEWDGTATSTWSRTDEAANFTNPVPAVGGGTGSSPFDELMPWSGMVRVTDPQAGELVAIPKFWYKWTRSGTKMKLQIATAETDGFYVSPAHADRGDGKGERDVIYVGRYHCGADNYKSTSGVLPKNNITRATARTNIHALGEDIWQFDYATLWTIQMLYLVEYGNWNSQAVIGYGGGNARVENVGASDAMQYHTGTMQAGKTTYGVGCQYRNIEDLWGNVCDWCDGIYFNSSNVYAIMNPTNFSDRTNGILVGTRFTNTGYISAYTTPTVVGYEWALYPSAISGAGTTYVCDRCYYSSSGTVLYVGGYYGQDQNYGLFFLAGHDSAPGLGEYIGCRIMKLP